MIGFCLIFLFTFEEFKQYCINSLYGILFIFCLYLLFAFYISYETSKKETVREKIGEALVRTFAEVFIKLYDIVLRIFEPAEKRKIRLAKEKLANRNYQLSHYSAIRIGLDRLLQPDETIVEALDTLDMSLQEWTQMARDVFYIGVIVNNSFGSTKSKKRARESVLKEHEKIYTYRDKYSTYTKEALDYFDIPIEEWIEIGSAVIDIYELYNRGPIKEIGISR